jgi:hypothetical protein
MRSPCCLYIYVSPLSAFECLNQSYEYHGNWICPTAYFVNFSRQSVYPYIVARHQLSRSVTSATNTQATVRELLDAVRVVSKKRTRLVLPRTFCCSLQSGYDAGLDMVWYFVQEFRQLALRTVKLVGSVRRKGGTSNRAVALGKKRRIWRRRRRELNIHCLTIESLSLLIARSAHGETICIKVLVGNC